MPWHFDAAAINSNSTGGFVAMEQNDHGFRLNSSP
jgi:hypothetical protein